MNDTSTTIEAIRKVRFGVMATGIVGNFISFLIFSRKAFRKNSINVYCRALSISDSLIISFQFANDFALIFFNIDLFSSSNAFCKLSNYIFVSASPISGWILVAFSIDKAMCVLYPTR